MINTTWKKPEYLRRWETLFDWKLSNVSSYTINKISENLGMSHQGARKQLEVLVASNLVKLEPVGRETQVILNTVKLQIAQRFIDNIEQQWDRRLHELKAFTEKDAH